jgi:gliding motility-associated-like protein
MKKSSPILLLVFALFCFGTKLFSQCNTHPLPNCPNADLSQGNYNNWVNVVYGYGKIVNTSTTFYAQYSNYTPGKYGAIYKDATKGTLMDPNTGNKLPRVYPGTGWSMMINDSTNITTPQGGNQSEIARYTFTVDKNNAFFVLHYAAVMATHELCLHEINGSPDVYGRAFFKFRVFRNNDTAQKVNSTCSSFWQVSYTNEEGKKNAAWKMPGFKYRGQPNPSYNPPPPGFPPPACAAFALRQYDSIAYKPWSAIGVDLSNEIGNIITLEFTVATCNNSGNHWAYAYISSQCFASTDTLTYCSGKVTLNAPKGFAGYQWSSNAGSATTDSVVLNNPAAGTYTCNIKTDKAGCDIVRTFVILKQAPKGNYTFTAPTCANTTVNFTATIPTSTCNPITAWKWDFGDGTSTSATQNPSHTYIPGTYTASLILTSQLGCMDTTKKTITVPSCGPLVTATGSTICIGGTGTLTATGSGGSSPYTYSWSPNTNLSSTTGSSVNASPATTIVYTVTATDNAGKTATATAAVTVNPKPTITLSSASVCPGACATITAVGGVSYSWSAPLSGTTSTQSACPAATTTYSVTGTDANGCSNTATATVTVNPLPTVTVTDLTVCKDTVGTITASGASTYTWSCGGTGTTKTPNTSVIGVSTCTVTGTDANGCVNTAVSTITVNDCSTPSVNVNNGTICIGNCLNLTAVGIGGVGALTYTWNPNLGTGAGPFNVCPTTTSSYTVTVSDANGATASDVAIVTVNPLPTITATTATICNGACATITANGAGTGTYTWSSPLGSGSSQNVCPATTTSYSLTGTDANGCTNTATTTVTVNPLPIINVPDANICPGGSTALTASGANTYTWSPGTGLSATTGITVTANPASTSTYTVCGTSIDGCSSCTTVKVTVGALVATTGPNATICFGACTNLTSGGGTIYSWSPATGLSDPNISNPTACPTVTTTYTVNVSDGTCSDDAVVVVTVDPAITLNVAPVNVTCFGACNGQTIVIPSGGNGSFTYNWSSGCTAAACNNVCAGTYTLTATDGLGCTATGTTTVTEPPALTMAVTGQTNVSCFGLCDGTAGTSAAGGTTPYNYSWTPGGGMLANATALCAGTFTCTVTDANNCSLKTPVTITQPTKVVVTSAGASICPNTSTTLNTNATGGTGTITFAWSPATGLSPATGNSVTANPVSTTMYTITGTDANGCVGSTSVTVTVNPAPVINVPPATICENTSTSLNATGANIYTWSPTTGLNSGTGTTVTANPTSTTTYTVIGTSTFGCTNSTTVIVTVNPAPIVSATGDNACPGDTIKLTASGAVTYSWIPASGLSSMTGSTVISKPSKTTTYTITGTSANGCTATAIAIATVNPKPTAAFTTSPQKIDILNPTVYFTDQSTGGIITKWNWSLGDIANSISKIQNPSFTYPDIVEDYQIQLIVTNQFGCIDTVTGTVFVHGIFTFFIPNTFTPDGDGINDGFMAKGVGIDETDYDLWVFDRWGNLIWHTEIWGEAWDGRANGGANIAQIDTYVWKVHVREKESGIKHNYIGHVNIVK